MTIKRECLYDVKWQELRVSLLGKFRSIEGVKQNIERLKAYIGKGELFDETRLMREWRALNLCNAVRMSYGGQEVDKEVDRLLTEFRDQVQDAYNTHKTIFKFPKEWNWRLTEGELVTCKLERPESFKAVRRDLIKRADTTLLKRGDLKHRPELVKFLELVDKVDKLI
jgi:hypothetical protein